MGTTVRGPRRVRGDLGENTLAHENKGPPGGGGISEETRRIHPISHVRSRWKEVVAVSRLVDLKSI